MVAELGGKQVVSSGSQLGCWHGLLARQLPVCFSSIFARFPICWCGNGSRVKDGNRKKHRDRKPHQQLEMNSVNACAARMDAEQHVTVQRQRLTRKLGYTRRKLSHQDWRKTGKPEACVSAAFAARLSWSVCSYVRGCVCSVRLCARTPFARHMTLCFQWRPMPMSSKAYVFPR